MSCNSPNLPRFSPSKILYQMVYLLLGLFRVAMSPRRANYRANKSGELKRCLTNTEPVLDQYLPSSVLHAWTSLSQWWLYIVGKTCTREAD